ncbi:MAG: hypothetical protein JRN06_07505 [Nitrososphaerota archaeon]|nr:hypothetical protein [Nitrososphaerota archaeon]MDG7024372.1 hypothetical protein [Nitrososphaerota archaeon]
MVVPTTGGLTDDLYSSPLGGAMAQVAGNLAVYSPSALGIHTSQSGNVLLPSSPSKIPAVSTLATFTVDPAPTTTMSTTSTASTSTAPSVPEFPFAYGVAVVFIAALAVYPLVRQRIGDGDRTAESGARNTAEPGA